MAGEKDLDKLLALSPPITTTMFSCRRKKRMMHCRRSEIFLAGITNHHDRDLVTPAHENYPLSPEWGGELL